jgi:hypothetical protein
MFEDRFETVAPLLARDADGVLMCFRVGSGKCAQKVGAWIRLPDGQCFGRTARGIETAPDEEIVAGIVATFDESERHLLVPVRDEVDQEGLDDLVDSYRQIYEYFHGFYEEVLAHEMPDGPRFAGGQ